MSEDKKLIEQVVEQSKDVLGKGYDDLVHPTAKSLGNTLSLLPRTVGVWLGKWEKWVINGEESIKLTAEAVRQKASKIPEEKLTEPEPYVAVPAIQQLSYCYDSEELRELYANLLVSSMNSDTKSFVHPSFVDIIKQMSPLDAKAVERIQQESNPMPIVTSNLNYKQTDSFIEIVRDYSFILFPIYNNINLLSAGLQNLKRLGIVNVRYDQYLKSESVYDAFEKDEVYESLITEYNSIPNTNISLKKGLIELTDFGQQFCKICCGTK